MSGLAVAPHDVPAGDGGGAVEVRLLGPLEVLVGGRAVPLPVRQTRAVLAALALRHPVAVSAHELSELLWPDGRPERWEASLYAHVSRLRRVLGTRALVRIPAGYRLADDVCRIDLDGFEADLARGRAAAHQDDPATAEVAFTDALARWRGPALRELEDLSFAEDAGRRLDGLRASAIEGRADALLALGRDLEAAEAAADLVELDPFHEPAWELRVAGLTGAGRTAEARQALAAAADTFDRELGIGLGNRLLALRDHLDAGLPATSRGAAPEPQTGPRSASATATSAAVARPDPVGPSSSARLETLSPEDRWVFGVLAVAGPHVDPTVLATAAGVSLPTLFAAMARLDDELASALRHRLQDRELAMLHRRLIDAAPPAAVDQPQITARARWALGAVPVGHPVTSAVATSTVAIVAAVQAGRLATASELTGLLESTIGARPAG